MAAVAPGFACGSTRATVRRFRALRSGECVRYDGRPESPRGPRPASRMKQTFLDFEQPIADLQAKIDELRYVHEDSAVDISDEISRLQKKSQQLTKEIYGKLSSWQIAQVARHPQRPYTLDYLSGMFSDFRELHGDRSYADDPAIVGGLARFNGQPCVVIGQQKGPRHQGEDPPQLRHAAPGGLPQGAAPHEARREILAAAVHVHRHARRLPGHRRRGARPVRGHRPQPLRDGRAARADHRHRHRRGRLGRRARHRGRRRHADAAVLHLLGDLAGGLRLDPVEIARSTRRRPPKRSASRPRA